MLSVKDVSIVYETLLSSPGMSEAVKITLHIPRKHVLLLSKIIEVGIAAKNENGQTGILNVMDETTTGELQGLSEDILRKAGLTEMNDKLNGLQTK